MATREEVLEAYSEASGRFGKAGSDEERWAILRDEIRTIANRSYAVAKREAVEEPVEAAVGVDLSKLSAGELRKVARERVAGASKAQLLEALR